MKDIIVIDDFFKEQEWVDFNSSLGKNTIKAGPWKMQSSDKDNNSIPGDTSFFIRDLQDEQYVITNIFNKIKKILGDNINLGRVYLNGQFPGRNGSFHVDGCDRTVLIYLSKWDVEWGGFTHILGENFPESKIIEPIFNRFVCFPGNLLHKAYSFSYQHCPMRISLAYKLNFL